MRAASEAARLRGQLEKSRRAAAAAAAAPATGGGGRGGGGVGAPAAPSSSASSPVANGSGSPAARARGALVAPSRRAAELAALRGDNERLEGELGELAQAPRAPRRPSVISARVCVRACTGRPSAISSWRQARQSARGAVARLRRELEALRAEMAATLGQLQALTERAVAGLGLSPANGQPSLNTPAKAQPQAVLKDSSDKPARFTVTDSPPAPSPLSMAEQAFRRVNA